MPTTTQMKSAGTKIDAAIDAVSDLRECLVREMDDHGSNLMYLVIARRKNKWYGDEDDMRKEEAVLRELDKWWKRCMTKCKKATEKMKAADSAVKKL